MTAEMLFQLLTSQGVRLAARGDRLHIEAPAGVITSAVRAQLSEHKARLLALLHQPKPGGDEVVDLGLTDLDRRTIKGIRDGDTYRLPSPSLPDPQIPGGWTRVGWIERLRQLADTCEPVRPDLAADHRAEADRLSNGCEPNRTHGGTIP